MISKGFKKVVASMVFAAALVMSAGFVGESGGSSPVNSVASAQYYRRGWDGDRDDWQWRVRRLDRNRQIRYRMQNRVRVVGFYDRFGRFHAYGFIDRFGRLHRY